MIMIIDDDIVMAECIARACAPHPTTIFSNAIDALTAIDAEPPSLIFLDILLDGPDGFTLLNELASYTETATIPIIIVSSLNLRTRDLSNYGVIGILNKDTMTPQEIASYVQ